MLRGYFFLFLYLYVHGNTIKSQRSNLMESHQGRLQINNNLEPLIHPKLSTENSRSKRNVLLNKTDVHNHRNKFIKLPSSLKPILHGLRHYDNSSIFEPSVRDPKILTETILEKYNNDPFVTWGERKKTRRHHVLYPWEQCEKWIKNEDGEKILIRAQRKYDDITFQPYPFQLLSSLITLLIIRVLKINNIFYAKNETEVKYLAEIWNNRIVYQRFWFDYKEQYSKIVYASKKDQGP